MAGMLGDEGGRLERLALLPHPRGMLISEGRGSIMSPGIDWLDWIAPQWLARGAEIHDKMATDPTALDPIDAMSVAGTAMGGGMGATRPGLGMGGRWKWANKDAKLSVSQSPANPEWTRAAGYGVTVDYEVGPKGIAVFDISSSVKGQGNAERVLSALRDKHGSIRAEGVMEDSPQAISFWQNMLDKGVVQDAVKTSGEPLIRKGK